MSCRHGRKLSCVACSRPRGIDGTLSSRLEVCSPVLSSPGTSVHRPGRGSRYLRCDRRVGRASRRAGIDTARTAPHFDPLARFDQHHGAAHRGMIVQVGARIDIRATLASRHDTNFIGFQCAPPARILAGSQRAPLRIVSLPPVNNCSVRAVSDRDDADASLTLTMAGPRAGHPELQTRYLLPWMGGS